MVAHTNTYETEFLDCKEAAQFQTVDPLALYYSITMNPDYCFDSVDILSVANKEDATKLLNHFRSKQIMELQRQKAEEEKKKKQYMK